MPSATPSETQGECHLLSYHLEISGIGSTALLFKIFQDEAFRRNNPLSTKTMQAGPATAPHCRGPSRLATVRRSLARPHHPLQVCFHQHPEQTCVITKTSQLLSTVAFTGAHPVHPGCRDMSGDSLHRRGYRSAMHKASLNEAAAAGCLALAGWPQAAAAGMHHCPCAYFPAHFTVSKHKAAANHLPTETLCADIDHPNQAKVIDRRIPCKYYRAKHQDLLPKANLRQSSTEQRNMSTGTCMDCREGPGGPHVRLGHVSDRGGADGDPLCARLVPAALAV